MNPNQNFKNLHEFLKITINHPKNAHCMKTFKKRLLLTAVIIFATVLVSWNLLKNSTEELNISGRSSLPEKNFQGFTEAQINALLTEDEGSEFSSNKAAPPAEDV